MVNESVMEKSAVQAVKLSEAYTAFKDSMDSVDKIMHEIGQIVESRGEGESAELIGETYAPLIAECLRESLEILEKWIVSMRFLPAGNRQGMLF